MNKTLNTRIKLKYDSYSNWLANDPVPLIGELCIAEVPAATNAVPQEPAIIIKAGDGVKKFSELPILSGLAADVHDWAKASTKPTYAATEITGLEDYITGVDTDTQYTLEQDAEDSHKLILKSKAKGASEWTNVVTITTADTVYDDTALSGRVTSLETLVGSTAVATQIANAIDALKLSETYATKTDLNTAWDDINMNAGLIHDINTKIGIGAIPDGKTVVEMIADAQSAATYDDTEVRGLITANTTAISTLNGEGEGSVKKQVADAVATIVADAPEAYDTLKEISDWISSHSSDAASMNSAIQTNTSDISALKRLTALPAESYGKTTLVDYFTYISSKDVSALENTINSKLDNKVDKVEGKGLSTYDLTEALYGKLLGIEDGAQVNNISGIELHIGSDAAAGSTIISPNDAKLLQLDLGALAGKDTVAKTDLTDELKTEIEGKANSADLAAIATTGNVNDLVQTSGEYMIFDCGSSSVNI